jgi:hypothetical protein
MSLIIGTVSRKKYGPQTRFSALSAMPRGCATLARKDLSELTLAKLKDGLWERGITGSTSTERGVERALNYLLQMQTPATGKVTGV